MYTLPSDEPKATLRAVAERSQATLLIAREETLVETIGTYHVN